MSNVDSGIRACRLALVFALLLVSCAINRNVPVTKSFLVSSPSTMTRDRKVQWARVAPGFRFADYSSTYVPEVLLQGSAAASPLGPTLVREFRKMVVEELAKKYPVTTKPPPAGGSGRIATLQLAISDIRAGNGFVRWFCGFGMAPTILQVEGRITEGGASRPVVEFVRRRSFDGFPGTIPVYSEEQTHRASMREIARDIAAFLGRAGA